MDHNRTDKQSMPNRSSNMEQAEGSRDTVRENERMSGSEEMRNRESSPGDLGSSSDRAMFSDPEESEGRVSDGGSGDERGMGSSGERNLGGGDRDSSKSGGITNRPLDREQSEQQQLPDRGRSQSESER